ncbi:MAG: PHP domain-containing protein [Candidatus Lokiarchaeota archaeon]|nr:PHP domain-containing protein [Candidatus Lokiarchaeota archaeon]
MSTKNIELYDLHIHTEWSDGDDPVDTVIKTAEDKGLKVIGICDHLSEIKASVPFEPEGIQDYITEIRECAENYKKVQVFIGLEIDFFPIEEKGIDLKVLKDFDYLLFEDATKLQTLKKLSTWAKEYQNKNKNPLIGISHPNLRWPDPLMDKMLEFISDAHLFLEFNANYTSNYEEAKNTEIYEKLKNLKNIKFSICSDSHSISTIGNFNYAWEFLEGLGFGPLEDRLPELFKIKS